MSGMQVAHVTHRTIVTHLPPHIYPLLGNDPRGLCRKSHCHSITVNTCLKSFCSFFAKLFQTEFFTVQFLWLPLLIWSQWQITSVARERLSVYCFVSCSRKISAHLWYPWIFTGMLVPHLTVLYLCVWHLFQGWKTVRQKKNPLKRGNVDIPLGAEYTLAKGPTHNLWQKRFQTVRWQLCAQVRP